MSTQIISTIMDVVVNNILVPVILIIGSTILVVIKGYAEKITMSILSKNEMECLEVITTAKNNLLKEVSTVVEAAVCANMRLAEELKAKSGKLSIDEIQLLNKSAKQGIYNSLPESLTTDGGALSKIIGGEKSLDNLIDGLIEKYVSDQKKKDK